MPRSNPEVINASNPTMMNLYGSITTGSYDYQSLNRSYTSVNSPGYPEVKDWHAHNMVRRVVFRDPGFMCIDDRRAGWWDYNYVEMRGSSSLSSISLPANIYLSDANEVLALATGKIIDAVKNEAFNLANDIGEYRQTVDMMSTTARRLAGGFRALRRGDLSAFGKYITMRPSHAAGLSRHSPLEIARNAGNYWLEAQYGWLPLVNDVYEGVTHLHDNLDSKVLRKKASRTINLASAWTEGHANGVASSRTIKCRTRAKIILEYKVNRRTLASLNDWGVTNPLDLAWELMPYSFVVDWFLPVGNYLSRLDAFIGLTFLRGSQSTLQDAYFEAKYMPGVKPVGYWNWQSSGKDTQHHTDYHRTMLSAFPSVPLPRLKNPLSPKHIANAMSLLAQAFL